MAPFSLAQGYRLRGVTVRQIHPWLLLPLLAILPAAGVAQAPAVSLPLTFEHTIHSRINGRDYRIQVALPFSAANRADTTHYPTIYLLDGELFLPQWASTFRTQFADGSSNVIMVGVGYPASKTLGTAPPGDGQLDYRWRDYTPPHIPDSVPKGDSWDSPLKGHADLFLRVLKEEIIPFVERTYPASNDRAIRGHSLGGAFVIYTLLTEPDLFTRYAITSPSYWWDDFAWVLREKQLASTRHGLDKTVYVSVGEFEGAEQEFERTRFVNALCDGIRSGAFQGLQLITEVIPGTPHLSFEHDIHVARALYPSASGASPPDPVPADPCRNRTR